MLRKNTVAVRLEELPMRVSTSDERDFEMDEETDYLLHARNNGDTVRIMMMNESNNRIRQRRRITKCCSAFFTHVLCG